MVVKVIDVYIRRRLIIRTITVGRKCNCSVPEPPASLDVKNGMIAECCYFPVQQSAMSRVQ